MHLNSLCKVITMGELTLGLCSGALIMWVVLYLREKRHTATTQQHDEQPTSAQENTVYDIAQTLQAFYDQVATSVELQEHPQFIKAVSILREKNCSTQELLNYYHGSNDILSCIALEALRFSDEEEDILQTLLEGLSDSVQHKRYFELQLLHQRYSEPLIGRVLLHSAKDYLDKPQYQLLREFVAWRIEKGETLQLQPLPQLTADEITSLITAFEKIGDDYGIPLRKELDSISVNDVDVKFLQSIGKVWQQSDDKGNDAKGDVIEHPALLSIVQSIEKSLTGIAATSVVLVGETGVGKTSTLSVVGQRMQERGWTIFEAGSTDLLAGQMYIGQLEQRLQELLQKIGTEKKVVWIIPNMHTLLWAGLHKYNQSSILDDLLPAIGSGTVRVIGVTHPAGFEQLLQLKPMLRSVVEAVHLQSLGKDETIRVAMQWADKHGVHGEVAITQDTIVEAYQLAVQYMGEKASPGNILALLHMTKQRLLAAGSYAPGALTLDRILATLSQVTGIPTTILDDRQGIDIDALQDFFQQRVHGQPEAIRCLVERVAMIKAGLTDPARPQGVFLFAGPTGTGKTEIAKTLARFLFGSHERLIRLDMSEFQTAESLSRILGDHETTLGSTTLVNLVRNQPFSVVLLDEFEKAHHNVWDLFLQVFDDGRLTDRRGNTVDFRHCIIILTSNLGATISRNATVGFASEVPQFTPSAVDKAIETVFRKEFINRLDRIVVFQPLSRSVMKDLLHKELRGVLQRRGLRNRAWVIEWEDSAIEFLLAKGFTPDLGARPLKRAIERYVLSPLALTIVKHQVPEGEQFLFVRSDSKKIVVEFIDPDAPVVSGQGEDAEQGTGLSVSTLVLHNWGTVAEYEFLHTRYTALAERLQAATWNERKEQLLESASLQEDWKSLQRITLLSTVEYIDRIEVGVDTATSLLQRLHSSGERKETYSQQLISRLAQQIYLLETACDDVEQERPHDAFLCIESTGKGDVHDVLTLLGDMYKQWATKRKMQCEILDEQPYPTRRLLLAISGYGAYSLLQPEHGIHAIETREGKEVLRRSLARVYVLPQPTGQPYGEEKLRDIAVEALAGLDEGAAAPSVVRRYRFGDTPLVRDSIRQWRTGRIERVLEGDFDILS